ncbi:MAG: DUF998 domain-containing protein [Algicola sp.]|nr:DUF998 domain-containing protein [Algicola sp.]
MNDTAQEQKKLIISYMQLRRYIGYLGLALPVVLALVAYLKFDTPIQGSISAYYHTDMRDVFVGILFVIGFFLLAYKGHDSKDDYAGDAAFVFAVGMALFPTTPEKVGVVITEADKLSGLIHGVCAALFFITLIYFCLHLFVKTSCDPMPDRKRFRNKIYRSCGWTMTVCIALIGIIFLFDSVEASIGHLNPVFWLEGAAILAFALSWFTKGQSLARLKDL